MAQTSAAKNAAQNKSARMESIRAVRPRSTQRSRRSRKARRGMGHETWPYRPEQDVEVIPTGTLGFGYGIRHRRPA